MIVKMFNIFAIAPPCATPPPGFILLTHYLVTPMATKTTMMRRWNLLAYLHSQLLLMMMITIMAMVV